MAVPMADAQVSLEPSVCQVLGTSSIGERRPETAYSHLSSVQVGTGQGVEAGTVIGFVGSTGLSTGPRLHVEALVDGTYTDPVPWPALGQ
ncbi:M23 family metallopeptidase [Streptomyces sp. NPDC058614]|uniref:M23 family metallopeptidase n=1 Tax=Streptomyces sp. NPDC058614 TaxID=3346557 RepID=UPI003666149A